MSADGTVWVGTYHGIARFQDGQWYTDHVDHFVSDVAVDGEGDVWFATGQGVLRYDGETWTAYTAADGLLGDDVGALAVAPDGAVWAGTREGLSRFHDGAWTSTPIGER